MKCYGSTDGNVSNSTLTGSLTFPGIRQAYELFAKLKNVRSRMARNLTEREGRAKENSDLLRYGFAYLAGDEK